VPDEFDDDWETTALRRVAGRMEALPARPVGAPGGDDHAVAGGDDGYGWEDTVIRRLRAWFQRDGLDR